MIGNDKNLYVIDPNAVFGVVLNNNKTGQNTNGSRTNGNRTNGNGSRTNGNRTNGSRTNTNGSSSNRSSSNGNRSNKQNFIDIIKNMKVTGKDLKKVKSLVEENKIVEAAKAYINVFRNNKRLGINKFKSCRESNKSTNEGYFMLSNSYNRNNERCVALDHAFKIVDQSNMPEAEYSNSNSNNE